MFIKVKDININYVQYGKGKDIILLHGWGQNIEMMDPIGQRLKADFKITIIDFPGFGLSNEPTFGWTIYDYYEMLCIIIKQLKIKNPIIIGHSFGGRIAIIYASREKVDKLVLFASPFKKSENSNSIKTKLLKFLAKQPLLSEFRDLTKKYIGSNDYRNASIIMREVLVNTINEDLIECAKMIKCPTLLIWGSKDCQTSVKDAEELANLIENSGLIVYNGLGHYAYLEDINRTTIILYNLFKIERGL